MRELIDKQAAIDAIRDLPSAQPEYCDYSDIEPLWKSFAEENDSNLNPQAKQLKDAMWCGYEKGKRDAQSDHIADTAKKVDTISRQAAIDAVKDEVRVVDGYYLEGDRVIDELDAINAIECLPSAQTEQRWIPCSERLPGGEELVLVTDDSGGIKTVEVDRCGQYENSNERFWYYTQNVVAWMPLPEPYKERREE